MSQDTDVASSISKLALNTHEPTPKKKSKKVVADSWEDEDVSDSEPEINAGDVLSPAAAPAPPPPTPMSPISDIAWTPSSSSRPLTPSSRATEEISKRPEKTDAVARRMIAAGLGLKVPKQTDEQRAYQKSIREQEKKKREQERAEEQKKKEESERAKAAVWDD